jgi:TIR domain
LKFAEFDASESVRIPSVFVSYARSDTQRVDKLDQWLRDHEIRVIRDVRDFPPGSQILDNIWKSVLSADKVIAVYSAQSKTRDWPSFEHQIAEQVESQIKAPVLIYLRLDNTPLKAHDPHRIAIDAQGKKLKEIGLEIQKSLGIAAAPARFDYDEEAPL